MVQLVDAVLTSHVESVSHHVGALVERPVESETLLRAAEDAGVVGIHFALRECAVPQPYVIDVAREGLAADAVAAPDGECGAGVLVGDGVPCRAGNRHGC